MIFKAIGLMTGTSMDGIDGALIATDGLSISRHIASCSIAYDRNFHLLLRICECAVRQEYGDVVAANKNFHYHLLKYVKQYHINIDELRDDFPVLEFDWIIRRLTVIHHDVIKQMLGKAGVKYEDIDVIGLHGQTLYHNPQLGKSIQVGDGQLLANLSGIKTVNDFRAKDVADGGWGAPFAPLYHQALAVQSHSYPIAVVNCGGISNVTMIFGPNPEQVLGFDAGAGCVLIDRFVRERTNNKELRDDDGKYGLHGEPSKGVLQLLREESITVNGVNYLDLRAPKALDSSNCNLIQELDELSFVDACATLEAFTAQCIVDSIDLLAVAPPKIWALAGGGWRNPVIKSQFEMQLRQKLGDDVKVFLVDELGWHGTYLEAEIFAYLAVRSLKKLPISYPNITKVTKPLCGGTLYHPKPAGEDCPLAGRG
jgi:anhydro-N-acetylmuramic acid kinase